MAIIEYLYAVFEVINNEYPKGGHHATAHAYAAYIPQFASPSPFFLSFPAKHTLILTRISLLTRKIKNEHNCIKIKC